MAGSSPQQSANLPLLCITGGGGGRYFFNPLSPLAHSLPSGLWAFPEDCHPPQQSSSLSLLPAYGKWRSQRPLFHLNCVCFFKSRPRVPGPITFLPSFQYHVPTAENDRLATLAVSHIYYIFNKNELNSED